MLARDAREPFERDDVTCGNVLPLAHRLLRHLAGFRHGTAAASGFQNVQKDAFTGSHARTKAKLYFSVKLPLLDGKRACGKRGLSL
jgi:hypothetical protein